MDAYFQRHGLERVSAVAEAPDFGRPSVFVPQRRLAARRLLLAPGLAGAILALLHWARGPRDREQTHR
jgi:hypothetical protein